MNESSVHARVCVCVYFFKSSFLIYHNRQTIDTNHVSKLLRNGSSGVEEEEEEGKRRSEREGNELY